MTCLIIHQHCRQKQVQHSMPSRAETLCIQHSEWQSANVSLHSLLMSRSSSIKSRDEGKVW